MKIINIFLCFLIVISMSSCHFFKKNKDKDTETPTDVLETDDVSTKEVSETVTPLPDIPSFTETECVDKLLSETFPIIFVDPYRSDKTESVGSVKISLDDYAKKWNNGTQPLVLVSVTLTFDGVNYIDDMLENLNLIVQNKNLDKLRKNNALILWVYSPDYSHYFYEYSLMTNVSDSYYCAASKTYTNDVGHRFTVDEKNSTGRLMDLVASKYPD